MSGKQSKPLYHMFVAVPPRYDLINHVITLGLDTSWRRKAALECLANEPHRVLDLCCGTGDLAINLAQMAPYKLSLAGVDYSPPMLEIAIRKAALVGKARDIVFVQGNVARLPFPDGYFDVASISFAFRNLTYHNPLTKQYLAEIYRVLAKGGRFVIVETSQPESGLVRKLFHLYLRFFVAPVGQWLSGNKGAYHYLAESATHFYNAREARELLRSAGFSLTYHRPLMLGAVAIYTAVK